MGCQPDNLAYYIFKQGFHQGALLLKAQSNGDVLQNPLTPQQTQNYLRLASEILDFAKNHAQMNVQNNYSKFIQLDRNHVTTIVTAAHKDRLEPVLFEYPIVGKLPYKGFFEIEDAKFFRSKLESQNFDTTLRPVEAFSTLGWLPDPLLSTMFKSPARFTELLFHELTHSTFYFKSHADFNEAFASWMGFKLAIQFANSQPKSLELFKLTSEEFKKELTDSLSTQKELARLIVQIKHLAQDHYNTNSKSDRSILFQKIKSSLKTSSHKSIQKLAELEWNNALILAFGTYYQWIDPIEKYSQKNNLTPAQFLHFVSSRGESIVNEIIQFE